MAATLLAENSALAMKILSRDIPHKSDVGGVRLDLRDVAAVGRAYDEMLATVAARCPGARLDGVTLQPMIVRPRGIELIAGLADDPTFGPVVLFGHGGVAVEAIGDRALALPPLDLGLARDLISRTRVARLLDGYRDVPGRESRRGRLDPRQARAFERRHSRDPRTRSQSPRRRR